MVIDHKTIILSRTGKGLNLRKIAGFINVAFFWGVMLYLIRSLFLTVWGAGNALLLGDTRPGLIDPGVARMFLLYVGLVIIAASALWGWARYNRRRYGGAHDKRRVHPSALTLAELSDYTGFPVAKLLHMRRAKVLVAHFDETRELHEMDSYASVREKENLSAAGLPPFRPRPLNLVMHHPGPPPAPAEPVESVFYLDPSDSGLFTIEVDVEEAELVG